MLPVDRAQRVGRLLLLCAIVGSVAGLGGVVFEYLVSLLQHAFLNNLAGYYPAQPAGERELVTVAVGSLNRYILAVLPVIGGLLGGALVYYTAPEAEGHGTDSAIDAYHHKLGKIRARVPIVKTIASALTLGLGGSAGREGPIAQIGAGFGSVMSSTFKLSVRERRVLMVAGMAAGIGAVFRAPLAGALFAAEVLYSDIDMEFEVIVPAVISSIVAYSVFTMFMGVVPLFATPEFRFAHPGELIPYSLLTLAVATGARFYTRFFYGVRDAFKKLALPRPLKPALGGVVVGSFAFFLPEAMASGYGIVQDALYGQVSAGMLIAVVFGKVVTTSFTVGSGQSGGVFGPAIVIGGALGGAVGLGCHAYLPALSPPVGAFVMVGMAGFFAAAAHTPLSTIIMVSEITGNYDLLVPSMWVCFIAFLLVRRSRLYENQVPSRASSPVHIGAMLGEVLERLTVSDALRDVGHEVGVTVSAAASLEELKEHFVETHHACFPVVDENGEFLGTIDEQALRQAVATEDLVGVIIAADLIEPTPVLYESESLYAAMHKLVDAHKDELVVVTKEKPRTVIGTLSRRDLIAAYDTRISDNLSKTPS